MKLMNKVYLLTISLILLPVFSHAGTCNQGVEKEAFVKNTVKTFELKSGELTADSRKGMSLAAETYYNFSRNLDEDGKLCVQKFHGFDHDEVWAGQDTFTRFSLLFYGESIGVEVNFLAESARDEEAFKGAVSGALDFLQLRFGDGVSLGEAVLEVKRSSLAAGMSDTSFKICQTGTPVQCYNQAMYRLVTFPLTEDPEGYLGKGSAFTFAQLLYDRGAVELGNKLMEKALKNEDYVALYNEVNPGDLISVPDVIEVAPLK